MSVVVGGGVMFNGDPKRQERNRIFHFEEISKRKEKAGRK